MDFKQFAPFIVPLLFVAVIAVRVLRAPAPRRIRPNTLWIGPLLLACVMATVFAASPLPGPSGLAIFAGAAAAGAVVGYLRALHQEFSIDPANGNVMSKASPLGAILFLAVFAVRYALNYFVNGSVGPVIPQKPDPHLLLYTDAMLCFAFAVVTASAWEVWRRTRPLVVEHRDSRPPPA